MKKIVLVTGANKGIGFGIAKHLGQSGWQVIIGARDEQRAEKAIGKLNSAGVDVLGWVNIELRDLDGLHAGRQGDPRCQPRRISFSRGQSSSAYRLMISLSMPFAHQ